MDQILTGTTILDQNEPGSNGNEEYCTFPKAPKLDLHHQMQFSVIPRTLVGEEVLPLCRSAVNIFYSPSQKGSCRSVSFFISLSVRRQEYGTVFHLMMRT